MQKRGDPLFWIPPGGRQPTPTPTLTSTPEPADDN